MRVASSENGGCLATRLMKRFRALLRPSMNSLSAEERYGVIITEPAALRASAQAPKHLGIEVSRILWLAMGTRQATL